jgi:hypothetical protein
VKPLSNWGNATYQYLLFLNKNIFLNNATIK